METPNILDWLSVIGISSILGGGVSYLINYLLNIKEYDRKAKIDLFENRIKAYISTIGFMHRLSKSATESNPSNDKSKRIRAERIEILIEEASEQIKNVSQLLNYGVSNCWTEIIDWWSQNNSDEDTKLLRLKDQIEVLSGGLNSEYLAILQKFEKFRGDIAYLTPGNSEHNKYYDIRKIFDRQ